ncbi:LOW QUALITY PROTEIN: DDX4 isoform 8, partial [Pongo abelii]
EPRNLFLTNSPESSNDCEDNPTRNRGFSKRGGKDHILEQFVLNTETLNW